MPQKTCIESSNTFKKTTQPLLAEWLASSSMGVRA
jgi:hypothetical protein